MSHSCQCPGPGFCPRFNRDMNESLHRLCKQDTPLGEKYRRLWDAQATLRAKEPSLVEKVLNLGKAVVKHVANGLRYVTEETYYKRLEVCRACPLLVDNERCKECGCYITVKAKWASEDCPEKKWPLPVIDEKRPGATGCGGCGGR